MTCESCR